MRRPAPHVLGFTLVCLLMLGLACTEDDPTVPGPTVIAMSGDLELPEGAALAPEDLTLGFGDYDEPVDASAQFQIKGNEGIPGLAVAYEDSIPVLLAIEPRPEEGAHLTLDVHSTALALAFLNPFVCVSDPDQAEEVLAVLESLSELAVFEEALETALAGDIRCMEVEHPELDALLAPVVTAFINSYAAASPAARALSRPDTGRHGVASAATAPLESGEVVIDPGNIVGGHQVVHKEGDDFTISNWRGRWAICFTPTEDFWLFPNGTLLNALKGSQPWAPSKRDFKMSVTAGEEPKTIRVYGLGWQDDADNLWANLTEEEKVVAANAGVATILLEFVPHVISVVTNSSKTLGGGGIAGDHVVKMVSTFFKGGRDTHRVMNYIEKGDPWGLAWYVAKKAIKKVATNNEFKAAFVAAVGMQLSGGAVKKLACMSFPAVAGVMIGDSVTSVAKTYLGFVNSRFKTEFQIHRELIQEFGNIEGSVHDASDGKPIEGVTMQLLGDDENPLHPSHHEVTGADGGFYFENIMVGAKTLQVTKTGYESKDVEVTVEDGETATVLVELKQVAASGQARILDKILIDHGVTPATIRKPTDLDVAEIGGEGRTYTYWIDDGSFSLNLPVGTWWVKASHEDYHPDSVRVTVNPLGEMSGLSDLTLKPRTVLRGTVYLDMNNDGGYEFTYSFDAEAAAGAETYAADWPCVTGGDAGTVYLLGGSDSREGDPQSLIIMLDPTLITERGLYDLGGLEDVGCARAAGSVAFTTERQKCTYEDVGQFPLVFNLGADLDLEPCNCGITGSARGTVYLSDVGTELTDLVAGNIDGATLAGWNGCECSCCEDLDGDGEEDDWVVDCARAVVNVEFRLLVGTLTDEMMGEKGRLAIPRP